MLENDVINHMVVELWTWNFLKMFFIYVIVSEVWKHLSRIYAALQNFGPTFKELKKRTKRSVLRTSLVKYYYKIT